MVLYLFLGFAAVLFIWGIIFILRGYQSSLEESSIVPILDIKEIKDLKKSEPLPQTGISSVSELAVKENISKPNLLGKALGAKEESPFHQKLSQQLREAKETLGQLSHDNEQLKLALERELSSRKAKVLSAEEQKKLEDTESQLSQARSAIERLTEKNVKLEEQITQINEQLVRAKEQYNVLTQQYDEVKNADPLKGENQGLQSQIKNDEEKIRVLEENIVALKNVYEIKLKEAQAEAATLAAKQKNVERIPSEVYEKQMAEVKGMVNKFKNQIEELLQVKTDLELNLEKTKEFNQHLLEKEKMLRYELTKSRAQGLGLEKICADFKIQIDQMNTKAINRIAS